MTISSEGSWPTNSSPRASRAPKSRLHARTASWISSRSSDCGEMPVAGCPAWSCGPCPLSRPGPQPHPTPPLSPRDPPIPPLPNPAPDPPTWEPCEIGEDPQYSPELRFAIICPHPNPSPTSSEPEKAPILVSNPGTRPRPPPLPTGPHLQHGQDVEHGVGLASVCQHRLHQAAQRPARAHRAGFPFHAAAPRGRDQTSRPPSPPPGAPLTTPPAPDDVSAPPPRPSSRRAGPEWRAAAGMALFHVARYSGPEAAGAEADAEVDGRARALLERLRCRVRERQLQKQPPQQEPSEPAEAAQTAQAAGKRRRRPRRRRRRKSGGAPGSPHAPPCKRRKADDEDEDASAGGGSRGGAGPWDSGPRGADAPPRPRFCRAESSEEAPAGNSVGAEAAGSPEGQGGPPPEEASGPPAHALVLGGFGRSKAPKVSGPGGGCSAGVAVVTAACVRGTAWRTVLAPGGCMVCAR